MPDKVFLETFPLYRKLKKFVGYYLDEIAEPAIKMECQVCKSDQTFNMANKYHDRFRVQKTPTGGAVAVADYVCTSCRKFHRYFALYFPDRASVVKIGQWPSWSVAGDPEVERRLGDHRDLFKRGLMSEAQGYGIGAFAYYRRIVEELIDRLLDDIGSLLAGEELAKYSAALAATKATRVTQEKIDLVKDLLPPILCPDGRNPLGVLNSTLSQGLHADSDEDCLELAASVREILTFLVTQVQGSRDNGKIFTESMRKLLGKKNPGVP